MTEEQLLAIKMRAKYATDGPWKVVKSEEFGVQIGTVWEHGQLKAGVPIVTTAHGKGGVTVYINHVNAEFIAHAREDMPALIAEVEELQVENKRLREALTIILEDEAPNCDGYETLIHATARKALAGESNE